MLSLSELQHDFREAMNQKLDTIQNYIEKNNLEPSQRIQIYRNNYLTGLSRALQALYPTIQSLIGETLFLALAKEYIIQFPSVNGDIHLFGNRFAIFLKNFPTLNTLPYLSEVAQLEWAYHEAFHEEDASLFNLKYLQSISTHEYRNLLFSLHPSHRLLHFHYPIIAIWNLCQTENSEDTVELNEDEEYVLILRPHKEVIFEKLTPGEFAFLSCFHQKINFEKTCATALKQDPLFDINSNLQKHILLGTIVNFTL